jgi:hypothetical protein
VVQHRWHVIQRSWFYATHGDDDRNLDRDWCYAPSYLRRRGVIRAFVADRNRDDF